ncbi:Pedicted L-rhamnose permease, NCS1 Family [hydrothermal vent metagenome]|uniref:Pedicted L-rhamnose permease, NCS1 Family n=1 Tax=hydrothermal vent metagenome TaxID=652676 RepID=A0A3B1CS13_9ZZZZ
MAQTHITEQLDAVEEFEQEQVPVSKLKSWKSFLGMYAGEHTAGTEFVIGPLFVAHGATANDIVWGLLLGNLLAVLSWAFMTGPIAVKERVTLYYLLEKIGGKKLTTVYNLVNALMFCFLAGSMIAVSATAVGIPFGLTMPTLNDWLPNSVGWIVAVGAVGAVTTVVAMFGYNLVSKFANIASPWMILVFLASAVAVLPELGVHSLSDFWARANDTIWTGTPMQGQSQFTFWHIMFFAWFANMAMHIGMADLSILRYAKKWYYGFNSGAGMFVGHYMAWMASGILYALFLKETSFSTEFAPGPVAYRAAGIAGALTVIIAGWTTANPTIYRAGLALQAIRPTWKTWKVTLVVGLITTLASVFPALVMKLLNFVALYGLILMPMGAVIMMDEYVIPKLNLSRKYAETFNKSFNLAAAVAWGVTLLFSIWLNVVFGVEVFFLGLPGWFVASALYLVTSYFIQRNKIKGGIA